MAPVTIVIPARNEARRIPRLLGSLTDGLPSVAQVIVVDDHSTDDTAEVAERYPVRLVQHKSNRGKGVAIRTGIAEAQGENVVIMDADATYPVPAIKEMVDLLDENDLVRGIRESEPESMPVVNRIGNWLFNKLLAISHGLEGAAQLTGLYAIRRSEAVRLGTEARGFDIETEIGIKAQARGLRVAEIPIEYLPRVGEKKLSPWRDGLRILWAIFSLIKGERPLAFFSIVFAVLAALAIGLAAPIIVTFMETGLVPRLPTAILATGIVLLGFLSLVCGFVLDTVTRGRSEMKRLHYLNLPAPGDSRDR